MNKEAYKDFVRKLPYTLQFSGVISLLLLAVYGILYLMNSLINTAIASLITSFFGFFYLLLTVLIISIIFNFISPLIYSYFASNTVLDTKRKDDVTIKNFLRTYTIGNKPPMKGQLSVFRVLLTSILTYLLIVFVGCMIVYPILYNQNFRDYQNIFDKLMLIIEENSTNYINDINNLLTADVIKDILIPFKYVNFAGLFVGLYVFIHNINLNVFKYYLTNLVVGSNAKLTNFIFRNGLKKCRKDFYKDYYATLFPITIIYAVIVPLTYFLFLLIPNLTNYYVLNITTIFISFIILLPFMPISFNLYNDLFNKYSNVFLKAFFEIASKEIATMKNNLTEFDENEKSKIRQSEEVLKNIKKSLEESESENSEDSNENKENSDSNKENHDDSNDESKNG